jgi:hypothetical protein
MLTEGQVKTLIKRHKNFMEHSAQYLCDKEPIANPQTCFGIGYSGIVVEILELVLRGDSCIPELEEKV